jgi:hypothetical protein
VCHREHGYVLAVPNSSPLVAKLFEGTDWAGTPGSGGPWKDALRQAPPEIVVHDKNINRIRIAGMHERCCSLVVLKHSTERRSDEMLSALRGVC